MAEDQKSISLQSSTLKDTMQEPLLPGQFLDIEGKKSQVSRIYEYENHIFYLFINPKSGNHEGTLLLNLPDNPLTLEIENKKNRKKQINFTTQIENYQVSFFMVNLCDENSQQKGIEHIKQSLQDPNLHASVITCGGDGTVMWVSEVLHKNGVDLDYMPIGMMGLGTGNDFSRALGWGPSQDIKGLIKNKYKGLKKLALKWIQSDVSDFDIWDMKFETFKEGNFTVIKQINGKAVEKSIEDPETQLPVTVLKKTFCNYFSVGIDAMIGVEFDKGRTTSRIGNLCVYFCASLKKFFTSGNPKVGHEMRSLEAVRQSKIYEDVEHLHLDEKNQKNFKSDRVSQKLDNVEFENVAGSSEDFPSSDDKTEQIFKTRTAQSFKEDMGILEELKKASQEQYNQKIQQEDKFLKGSPSTILVLNINSYAAGATNVWAKGQKKGALEDIRKKKNLQQKQEFSKQLFSDGKIEILSFSKYINLGLEQVFSGNANRVAQGPGPYRFNFREKDQKGKPITSYFQMDGEYHIVHSPKQIIIKKSTKVPHGKIKVLVEEHQYQKIQKQTE